MSIKHLITEAEAARTAVGNLNAANNDEDDFAPIKAQCDSVIAQANRVDVPSQSVAALLDLLSPSSFPVNAAGKTALQAAIRQIQNDAAVLYNINQNMSVPETAAELTTLRAAIVA